jgi:signal transduction histidine kinase/CheY-like chemotaxis protein/HPt (histidine-containing phosphotransfer) domain-containing protein
MEITHRQGQLRILRHLFRQTLKPRQALRQWRRLAATEEEQTTHVFGFLDGRAIQCRGRPLMMNGQVEGRVLSVVDITERITRERELAQARDAATASAKAKSDFLAMMSHEIRTPLTGILGMTELVLDAKIDARQREYLEMVLGSAKGLLTVINDVLDFSRIEAGRLLIESIPFNLPATLREAAHPLKFQAAARGNRLSLDIDVGDLPLLRGDPARIRQIVINLLGNAIKFTEQGRITLATRCEVDTAANSARLRMSVHDTGIGIAKEKLDLIFDAFIQSDVSISRRFGGTGLGLAISSQLVKAMDGTIRVESVLGKGSVFHIELVLPLAPGDAAAMPTMGDEQAATIGPRSMNVLLVEDTRVNQVLIGALLKAVGHRVTIANNGEEAIQVASLTPFDLVLMDIQMPIMDGFAATKILRASGLKTPIVALTAHATEGFREECLAKGMNGYLSKPIDRKAFQQMVKTYASKNAPMADEAPAEEQIPPIMAQTAPPVPHFNIAAALDRLEGDTELFATLIEGTVEQARHDIGELRGAADARHGDAVRKIAHRLKGSLGAIGAEQAQETARLLEMAGKEQRGGEFALLLGRLEGDLALLEPILRNHLRVPR